MIVITGASEGLGLELAKLFAAANKRVVNIARHPSASADTNLPTDLRDATAIRQAARAVAAIDEPLEAVIYCAGVLSVQPLGAITGDQVERIMAINVSSILLLTSQLANRIKQDGADIVAISSTLGRKGYADLAAYGASKWAVRGLCESLRADLKPTRCRVICVCPGAFESGLFVKATGAANTVNTGKLMRAKDVAQCIKQLLDLPKAMEVSEIVINRRHTQ
jgi:NADP-dependent 3-hydroxy acid dehydrogenase YdfG